MSSGLNLTEMDAALKQHYTTDRILNMVYKDNPLFAMMSKYEAFGGRNLPIVTIWGNPQGRSATFTRAQTRGQVTSSKLDDFLLTRVHNYSIATIDNETLKASEGDANAFLEAATVEIDGAINSLTRDLAIGMYRDGYGSIGRVGNASFATTVLTLGTSDDVTNFEVGQELVLATTSGASVLKALGSSGNGLIITGVDRMAGTLTFGFNLNDATNGIPTIAQGDYIFIRGDRQDSATPARTKLSGLDAWVPSSAPTSTPFFGVDRSQDSRLGGLRYDATALPIEEGLITGAAMSAREGAKIDTYMVNYAKYAELEKALGSKVQYIDLKTTAEISFRGIQVNGPRGMIRVIPDQNCPSGIAWGLQLDTWKLYSLGKAVQIVDSDGLMLLRQPADDGVEVRIASYSNVGCRAPGFNIRVSI